MHSLPFLILYLLARFLSMKTYRDRSIKKAFFMETNEMKTADDNHSSGVLYPEAHVHVTHTQSS